MKWLILILVVNVFSAFGQMTEIEVKNLVAKSSESELLGHSSRFLQESFYHFADITVDKLLSFDKKNGNYNYRKGFILLGMNKSPELALTHLLVASKKTEVNYDIYSPTEKSAPIDVFFYLGICYQRLNQLDKAEEHFKLFLKESTKQSVLFPISEVRLLQVANAKKLMSTANGENPALLNGNVNTAFDETMALISADGKSLVFTSARQREDKLSDNSMEPMFNTYACDPYQITKNKQGKWSDAGLFKMNDAKIDERLGSISLDERMVAFSNPNAPYLYTSKFFAGVFEKPKSFPVSVDQGKSKTPSYQTHLTLSADGNTGVFASNASTGKGGLDLFIIENTNGTWSEAKNIAMLNTEFDESGAFLSLDGKTLYFSSNSKASMGGFDIFKATRDENGMWSKPENMGYPLNSTSDEVGFSVVGEGSEAYLVSNRIGGVGMYDLYSVNVKETPANAAMLNGRIVNTKGMEIPEQSYMTIKCLDCKNTSESILTPRMRDGVFISNLEKCKQYELAYYYGPNTTKPYKNTFKTNCESEFEIVNRRVLILDADQKIVPFPTYEIAGIVTDVTTGSAISGGKINLNVNQKSGSITTNTSGMYSSDLISGYEFESSISGTITAEADGYLMASNNLSAELLEDSVVYVNFKLEALSTGILGPYIVNYQFNKFEITDYSKKKLVAVIQTMNDNPTLQIEIRSHTDSRGPAIYNQWLSDMRAKKAKEYIQTKIVNPDRISHAGYGESELLVPCGDGIVCSEAEHIKNRRTEFIIK